MERRISSQIAPVIRARIELTPTATRREDEIQSYLDLSADYNDDQIALCLERIGSRSFYPLSSLRVWIDGVLQKNNARANAQVSSWGDEMVERAEKLYTQALKRFERAHPAKASRGEALKSYEPNFPLPSDWLERLAVISWDEATASGAEAATILSQIWPPESAKPGLSDK